MQEQFFNIVGAERRSSEANEHTICPRTGKALWEAPLASSKDLEDAVSAAQTSSKSWAKTDFDLRQNLLRKFASEITAQTTFLSEILSRETGKTVS
jgi:acyl-CoA reductase-like NAD-dependent aldehyde dehydrogenase